MKNTIIAVLAVLILAVGATLLVLSQMDGETMPLPAGGSEAQTLEPLPVDEIYEDSDEVFELSGPAGDAVFHGMGHWVGDKIVNIEATVKNSATGTGLGSLPVEIFCDGKAVGFGITDIDGYFSLSSECRSVDSVTEMWAEVFYNDNTYESDHIWIPAKSISSGGKVKSLAQPAGVPEFSTITLAIAVIGGALGMAVMRKR